MNIFLALYQFNFQPIAWYITIGWIAVGLLLYYAVFEKQSSGTEPKVLITGQQPLALNEKQPCVAVALYNPDNISTLLKLAYSIAEKDNLRVLAFSVVEVPRQMPIHEGMRFAHHSEPLLKAARKYAADNSKKIDTDLVIAHNPGDGILSAAEQHRATSLVMGWKGFTNARDRIFGEIADKVIRYAPCDLLLLKIAENEEIKTCLFPTSGGPNAKLASSIIEGFSQHTDIKTTATYVVPENPDSEQKNFAFSRIDDTINNMDNPDAFEKELIESSSIAGGIAKAGKDYDLVVIGAAKEHFFNKMLFGEIPEKVARFCPSSVLVVKRYEGIAKKLIKKVIG